MKQVFTLKKPNIVEMADARIIKCCVLSCFEKSNKWNGQFLSDVSENQIILSGEPKPWQHIFRQVGNTRLWSLNCAKYYLYYTEAPEKLNWNAAIFGREVLFSFLKLDIKFRPNLRRRNYSVQFAHRENLNGK